MSKNSCVVYSFEGGIFDNVIAYSIGNYPGGKIPSFCKKKDYMLEYQSPENNTTLFQIYVEKDEDKTRITITITSRDGCTIEFDERQFHIEKSLCTYLIESEHEKLKYSVIEKNKVVDDETIKNLIHMYLYSSFFIYSYTTCNKELPFELFKNKKGKALKRFKITKKIMKDVIQKEIPSIGSSDFTNLNVIKFSPDLLDELYDMTKDNKTERFIYLPFEEFGIDLDNDIKIHSFMSDDKKYVFLTVFKNKTCEICIKLDINTGDYKYFVYNLLEKLIGIDLCYLAAYFVRLIKTILNYIAFYKIKKKKKKVSSLDNTATTNTTFSMLKSNKLSNSNVVTINTNLYNIEITNISLKNTVKRKKPEYIKYSWERRGHVRTYKNGKKVYIAPTNCQRKDLNIAGEKISQKHIYKLK